MLFVYFFVFLRLVPTWRGWWWIWCCRWDPRSRPSWEELLIILLLCCAVNNYWLHAIVEDQKCHVKRSKPTIGNKKLNVGFARKVQPTRQPKLEEGVVVVFRQIQRTKVSILLWSRFSRHITWICNAINIQVVLVDCSQVEIIFFQNHMIIVFADVYLLLCVLLFGWKIPTDMEVAPHYKLFTLFTLFPLLHCLHYLH